jgi:hypothetical protein
LPWRESQYYAEPKRLARLGYLARRNERGKTALNGAAVIAEPLSSTEVLGEPLPLLFKPRLRFALALADRSWGQVLGLGITASGNKKGHLLAFCEAL